jgi:hypothetical protein
MLSPQRRSDPRGECCVLLCAVWVNTVDPEHWVVDAAAHRVRGIARRKLYAIRRSEHRISEGSGAACEAPL